MLKINCERRSLSRRERRNYDEIQAKAPLNSLLVEIIIQPALKSPRLLAWKHVVRSYVSMLRRGSDFGPAGLSVLENRFFIFHAGVHFAPNGPTASFHIFFLVIVTADLTIKTLSKQRRWEMVSSLNEHAAPEKGMWGNRVCARGKKYQQVQYLPAFQVDSLGVCALWKNAVVKKNGRLRLYKCAVCLCIDASKRNSCSGMKIWSLLGLEGLLFYLTESEALAVSQVAHTHSLSGP